MRQLAMLSFFLLMLMPLSADARDARPELTVAISLDIPPYVMDGATEGLEVELMRALLPDHDLKFVQMPYAEIQGAVPSGKADVAIGVQPAADGAFYSRDVVTFVNYAITRTTDGIAISSVDDMAGHPVLTWDDAWKELGDDFERAYGPGGPQHADYKEFDDQADQVRAFWSKPGQVLVIDGTIFRYFSKQGGHKEGDARFADIFPPVTNFRAAFKDESLRDRFNTRLARLCADGGYDGFLETYNANVSPSVSDREAVRAAMDRYGAALNAVFEGDVGPMSEVWSHASDVYYMDPSGAYLNGWAQVEQSWREQAGMKLGGHVGITNTRLYVGRSLAMVTCSIVGENNFDGSSRAVSVRSSVLLRKAGGAWKVIGAHVDPIVGIE